MCDTLQVETRKPIVLGWQSLNKNFNDSKLLLIFNNECHFEVLHVSSWC